MGELKKFFDQARPVWPAGREREKNLLVGFRATFFAGQGAKVCLRLTASTVYRAFLNGAFIGHGPARGPHGYFRVDELELACREGENVLAIEVAGYNVNSFAYLDQPAFLQAEVVCAGQVLAATGTNFTATMLPHRVQRVQRYSYQRPFVEVYRLRADYAHWREGADLVEVSCAEQPKVQLLPRRVPYPRFTLRPAVRELARGRVSQCTDNPAPFRDRSLTKIGPTLGGFVEEELEVHLSQELDALVNVAYEPVDGPVKGAIFLATDSFSILDFGTNSTGFIGLQVECTEPAKLLFIFDELLWGGDVSYRRNHSVQAVSWELEPGTYHLETLEPYVLRYLKVVALGGACGISLPYVREYVNPEAKRGSFASSERLLNELFEAGRETFQQNAVDLFMDCPGRERAGWLCDSYFTAKVALSLTGSTTVEKNFLENFLLREQDPHLPKGMLPMCYPADHNSGQYIPQWPMWLVLQLEDYLLRTQDRALIDAFKPKVLGLLEHLATYRNADGLLERLPGWSYVDWSKANSLIQDVNYPTNMLYAAMLECVDRLYGDPRLRDEAVAIREVILSQSFNGKFFVDNAIRDDGVLKPTNNTTEACQYYAFYFELATPKTHPQLYQRLVWEFGPERDVTSCHPAVWPTDTFIGYFLRLEILARYGETEKLLRDLLGYFRGQVELTGTLWEHDVDTNSCNHGFASYVCHLLYRRAVGFADMDLPNKRIQVCLPDAPLAWCEGRLPLGAEEASLAWWKQDGRLHYRVRVPYGFHLEVNNCSGLPVVRHA